MSYSREAWDRQADLYEVIRTMPFNTELAAGTLSEDRFKHYITQDAHYLVGFGRALALAAAGEIPTMDIVKKEVLYVLGNILEKMGRKDEFLDAFKQIYEVDYGYKDVAKRVEGSY